MSQQNTAREAVIRYDQTLHSELEIISSVYHGTALMVTMCKYVGVDIHELNTLSDNTFYNRLCSDIIHSYSYSLRLQSIVLDLLLVALADPHLPAH